MGLENLKEIEEIRTKIKDLSGQREFNIKDTYNSVSELKKRYDVLVKENGMSYCAENCPDIPLGLNKLVQELRSCGVKV